MEAELIFRMVITGIGATLCMDIWSLVQKHLLRIPSLDYALVGRWLLWLPRGKIRHAAITATPAICGERAAGWAMHYATGIVFAFIPLVLGGADWFRQPDVTIGLLAGLLSLFAPFFIMQPALGFGIAAAKTPRPGRARLLSTLVHLIYGYGLYITAAMQAG